MELRNYTKGIFDTQVLLCRGKTSVRGAVVQVYPSSHYLPELISTVRLKQTFHTCLVLTTKHFFYPMVSLYEEMAETAARTDNISAVIQFRHISKIYKNTGDLIAKLSIITDELVDKSQLVNTILNDAEIESYRTFAVLFNTQRIESVVNIYCGFRWIGLQKGMLHFDLAPPDWAIAAINVPSLEGIRPINFGTKEDLLRVHHYGRQEEVRVIGLSMTHPQRVDSPLGSLTFYGRIVELSSYTIRLIVDKSPSDFLSGCAVINNDDCILGMVYGQNPRNDRELYAIPISYIEHCLSDLGRRVY